MFDLISEGMSSPSVFYQVLNQGINICQEIYVVDVVTVVGWGQVKQVRAATLLLP